MSQKITSFIYGHNGMGHKIRCRTIAGDLRQRGYQIAMGYVPNKVDIVIVDSKEKFDTSVLDNKKVILIDTFREDINADCIIFPHPWLPDKISRGFSILYGNDFIVLNPEVVKIKGRVRNFRDLLLFMGGRDPDKVMLRVVQILGESHYNQPVNAMFGEQFSSGQLSSLFNGPRPLKMHVNAFQPSLLEEVKAVVCMFGLTFYEMLYLSIPILVLAHTKQDDIFIRDKVSILDGVMYGGMGKTINVDIINNFLEYVDTSPIVRPICDDQGHKRIADEIESML